MGKKGKPGGAGRPNAFKNLRREPATQQRQAARKEAKMAKVEKEARRDGLL